MTYISRTLEPFLQNASNQFPVVLVTGARQTGKTTLLRHLAKETRTYIALDDPIVRSLAREDPALFLQRFRPPMLIDEIQYAPGLLPHIKITVDNNRIPGSFWLTGSQQFHLMKGVSESLAGRVGIVNLLGFSQRELLGIPQTSCFLPDENSLFERENSPLVRLPELFEKIWRGSFPALYQETVIDRELFYSSYLQTYLERDVRDLAHVGDEGAFVRFIRACAARTGMLLNMQDLCRDSDISQPTGKRWLSILVSSGIVYLLEPWSSNINKRLVRAPKLYFMDTGLAAYLTQWSTPEALEAGSMSGAILETWVLAEIIKSYFHNGKQAPVYYYRDKDMKEIDLLIHRDGILHPVEIKKTATPGKEAIRHFRTLQTLKHPIGEGCVICLTEIRLPISEKVQAVPIGML